MDRAIFIWVIYALWLILTIFFIVTAVDVKRDTERHLGKSFGRLFAIVAAFLLPRVPIFRLVNVAPVNGSVSIIGIILCAAGMAFLVWARLVLGRNWSQTVSVKEGHELVTLGPYHYVRHPMYTGGLVACIGSAMVFGGCWVFLLGALGCLLPLLLRAED